MAHSDTMTATEALGLLGLSGPASPEATARAFKARVKAVHPERGGGDADLFRRVIEAYRLLQKLNAARDAFAQPKARSRATEQALNISVNEALRGVKRRIRLPDGSRAAVNLPAGLRDGDAIRIKPRGERTPDMVLRVRIATEARREVQGHDLWLTVDVDRKILANGGRIEVDTPAGPRRVWIRKGLPDGGRLRVRGQGLPARGDHPAGDLYVRPAPIDGPSLEGVVDGAVDKLKRFKSAWVPGL
jgi:curved DNA-binding protein